MLRAWIFGSFRDPRHRDQRKKNADGTAGNQSPRKQGLACELRSGCLEIFEMPTRISTRPLATSLSRCFIGVDPIFGVPLNGSHISLSDELGTLVADKHDSFAKRQSCASFLDYYR